MYLTGIRRRGWKFYTFIGGAARFMFAWDSDLARVDSFARDVKECAEQAQQVSMHWCTIQHGNVRLVSIPASWPGTVYGRGRRKPPMFTDACNGI